MLSPPCLHFYVQDLAWMAALSHSNCSQFHNYPSWTEIAISGVCFICWPEISYHFLYISIKKFKGLTKLEYFYTEEFLYDSVKKKLRDFMPPPMLLPTHVQYLIKTPTIFLFLLIHSSVFSCLDFITWTHLCYHSFKHLPVTFTVSIPKVVSHLMWNHKIFRTGTSILFSDSTGVPELLKLLVIDDLVCALAQIPSFSAHHIFVCSQELFIAFKYIGFKAQCMTFKNIIKTLPHWWLLITFFFPSKGLFLLFHIDTKWSSSNWIFWWINK